MSDVSVNISSSADYQRTYTECNVAPCIYWVVC